MELVIPGKFTKDTNMKVWKKNKANMTKAVVLSNQNLRNGTNINNSSCANVDGKKNGSPVNRDVIPLGW